MPFHLVQFKINIVKEIKIQLNLIEDKLDILIKLVMKCCLFVYSLLSKTKAASRLYLQED